MPPLVTVMFHLAAEEDIVMNANNIICSKNTVSVFIYKLRNIFILFAL
jgi:hypothetical protein